MCQPVKFYYKIKIFWPKLHYLQFGSAKVNNNKNLKFCSEFKSFVPNLKVFFPIFKDCSKTKSAKMNVFKI